MRKHSKIISAVIAALCLLASLNSAKATDLPKGTDIPCGFENYELENSYTVVDNRIKKRLVVFRGPGGAHNASFIVALVNKKSCDILIEDDGLDITFVQSTNKKYPDISISSHEEEGSYYKWNGKKYVRHR
jgi:hypothetical protein